MKKIYLLLGLFIISTYAFSQEKITWGVHAGINVARVSDKYQNVTANSNSKVGFNGGVDLQLPVSSSFTIQPELNFSQLGSKADAATGSGIPSILTENYLSLPVLAKYTIPKTKLGVFT